MLHIVQHFQQLQQQEQLLVLTASITPSASSSKILVLMTMAVSINRANAEQYLQFAFAKNGSTTVVGGSYDTFLKTKGANASTCTYLSYY